jgi:hypothetical protein
MCGPLQAAVKKWADDTCALPDHVYFETEPMQNVDPGDPLDFSSARDPEAFELIRTRRLSKRKIAEGRRKEMPRQTKDSPAEVLLVA